MEKVVGVVNELVHHESEEEVVGVLLIREVEQGLDEALPDGPKVFRVLLEGLPVPVLMKSPPCLVGEVVDLGDDYVKDVAVDEVKVKVMVLVSSHVSQQVDDFHEVVHRLAVQAPSPRQLLY